MTDLHTPFFNPIKIPEASLPKYIEGYKLPVTLKNSLTWEYFSNKMDESQYYWVNTVNKFNEPHSVPVWGIWFENRLLCDGSPKTKWVRNMIKNPKVVVHIPSPTEVCMVEGKTRIIDDDELTKEMWDILDSVFRKKYGQLFGSPYIMVEPSKVLAWDTPTLERMTIWQFP